MEPPTILANNNNNNSNNNTISHKRPIELNPINNIKRPRFAFSFLTDPSIRFAISRFKEVSSRELHRLQSNGYEHETAVNHLVERMVNQTIGEDNSVFTKEEMDIVMQISGFSKEGALKALKLRSELKRLRLLGMAPIEAIQELANRVRDRGGSSPQSESNRRGARHLERNNNNNDDEDDDDDENREKRKRKFGKNYFQILTEDEDLSTLDDDSLTRPKRRKDIEDLQNTLYSHTDLNTDDSQNNLPHNTSTTTTTTTFSTTETTTTTTTTSSSENPFETNPLDGDNAERDSENENSDNKGEDDNDNHSQQSDFVADEDEDGGDDIEPPPNDDFEQYTFLNSEEWDEWDYEDNSAESIHTPKHSRPPHSVSDHSPPRVFAIENRRTNINEASSSREKGRRLQIVRPQSSSSNGLV